VKLRDGGVEPAEVEAAVSRAWRRVLDRQTLRVDAPFEAAGGDSLRLLKFVYHLATDLGRDIPLALFSTAGRPSDFAAALARFLNDGPSHHPDLPRVLFFAGKGGDEPAAAEFRVACGDRLAVLPIVYPHWSRTALDPRGFAGVVDDALAQIQRLAPHGPVRLAGYSFGGYVAYACVQALRRMGRDVVSLVIFDACMSETRQAVPTRAELRATLLDDLRRDGLPRTLVQRLAGRIARIESPGVIRFIARIHGVKLPLDLDYFLNANMAENVRMRAFRQWYHRLDADPQRSDLPVTVFRSAERSDDAPADLGWGRLFSGVLVVAAAGTHGALFAAEHRADVRAAFVDAMLVPRTGVS
jgi:thioesterase domain-containing protein